jgi:hypothetical protein
MNVRRTRHRHIEQHLIALLRAPRIPARRDVRAAGFNVRVEVLNKVEESA